MTMIVKLLTYLGVGLLGISLASLLLLAISPILKLVIGVMADLDRWLCSLGF